MRVKDFIVERKKKRKKKSIKAALWGPGPYGLYGWNTGYSGDGGIGGSGVGETSYPGNIGAMEVAKFFRQATDDEKRALKELINKKKLGLAWHLIQKVTGVKLKGQEFQEDRTADVVLDTGEKKKVRYHPTSRDIVDIIVNFYLKQGLKVIKVNDEEIEWDQVPEDVAEDFQQRSIDKLSALGMQGPYSKRDLVSMSSVWSKTLSGIKSSQIMVQDADNPRHSAWIAPAGSGQWVVGAETGYTVKSGPEALKRLQFFLKPTNENFADGKIKGKSRPGRVRRAGASCKGSVTDLRARAKKYDGEKGKMYHWCANMKAGKKK
jgi:hypothetical protein